LEGMDMTESKKVKRSISGTAGRGKKSVKKAARSAKATKPTRKKGNWKAGPGRPLGSKKDEFGMTPNQRSVAHAMLEAELKSGLFPATVREVADVTGKDPESIRKLLKQPHFQAYLFHLLELEGVVLEGAFWRSMALGLQVGDAKVMGLYAQMTGKIKKQEEKKVEVVIKAPDGQPVGLPQYPMEVLEAEIVDESE